LPGDDGADALPAAPAVLLQLGITKWGRTGLFMAKYCGFGDMFYINE